MSQIDYRSAVRYGLIFGVVALSVSAIGMVALFDERDIITGIFSLGDLLLFSTPLIAGYIVARPDSEDKAPVFSSLAGGIIAGVFIALPLVGLILLTIIFPNIRDALVNVSPALIEILTFGLG